MSGFNNSLIFAAYSPADCSFSALYNPILNILLTDKEAVMREKGISEL